MFVVVAMQGTVALQQQAVLARPSQRPEQEIGLDTHSPRHMQKDRRPTAAVAETREPRCSQIQYENLGHSHQSFSSLAG